MFKNAMKKVKSVLGKIKDNLISTAETPTSEILREQRGSGLVEYVGIAILALVLIVVVVLPAMKNMFSVDVFPGLSSQVGKIFNYS